MNPEEQHLLPTAIIESDHETVRQFVHRNVGNSDDPKNQAISLYYAVRDKIRYNPYQFGLSVQSIKASTTLKVGESWCVPKAALLAACCRAVGIPARLGFADVQNHLSTERLRKLMKNDVFMWHSYTTIYLNGQWLKATPAFYKELCEKFRLKTLDFDGQNDSIYHPFDMDGNKHMDYIRFRGEFDDVPLQEMIESFRKAFGSAILDVEGVDFDEDVKREIIS